MPISTFFRWNSSRAGPVVSWQIKKRYSKPPNLVDFLDNSGSDWKRFYSEKKQSKLVLLLCYLLLLHSCYILYDRQTAVWGEKSADGSQLKSFFRQWIQGQTEGCVLWLGLLLIHCALSSLLPLFQISGIQITSNRKWNKRASRGTCRRNQGSQKCSKSLWEQQVSDESFRSLSTLSLGLGLKLPAFLFA